MKTSRWVLSKDKLPYWLRQLRKGGELIGPLRHNGKDIVFKSVDMIHELELDCPASLPSPKEYLFPQFETMFEVTDGSRPTDLSRNDKRIIFGVRSCDISALWLADKFFMELGGNSDPFYSARRKNTLFISVVCNNPDPTCFCVGLGTGPYLEKGFDIQLTDLGDRYFVEAGSAQGHSAIHSVGFLFHRLSKADNVDRNEVLLSSKARFQKRIDLNGVRRIMLSGKVGDDFWRGVTQRCFECGGCVYECPLCTCFTVTDRTSGGRTERSRLWDTCFFKGFTRMAGGALPNEDRILRTKRWWYHKLVHYPDVLGGFGCTGCGRCTITCPGRIDMATISTKIKGLAFEAE